MPRPKTGAYAFSDREARRNDSQIQTTLIDKGIPFRDIHRSIKRWGERMDDESSISIVLTPVQLAAILQGESVSSETTLSNRLWGGLKLAGGVAEMIGGAALCAVPEPTGATKIGCVVLGGHGIDTASTGLQEVWTGQEIRSLTERGLTELATRLGAEPGSGKTLGMSVELAVPVGFAGAIKAARVTVTSAPCWFEALPN
ncbi:hypothetical protein RAS12_11410 [Achromobacter seleniivolatilans]|uniref:Uncharacterized protein n=1 Tax=Achromobacter seleniivolatilans TaxID=3047478 RepID=A0ABY9M7I1_9BURK|nr:hypothetical protein [Achromobacter sp. R39]WMD22951.1 hypothetical protein RAS12_11410 [Achromobacter sp. R39]